MWFRTLFDSLTCGRARTPARQAWRGDARRPAACRLSVEALDDRIVPASLSVGDATVLEGNAGTQYAAVIVSLDVSTNKTVTVNYSTAAGSATAGSDYNAVSGQLTFAKGETSKTILVPVSGDRLPELFSETFFVNLSGARGAKIVDGQAFVTIADDEPVINIFSGVVDGGGASFSFTVGLSVAYDQAVTVDYATADGMGVAGVDYAAASGTLTFAPGETTKTITVAVLWDTAPEPGTYFVVNLGGASANALIYSGQADGTYYPADSGSVLAPYGEGWGYDYGDGYGSGWY